ncbi:MAG: monovalent cation/H+ antiporter subunit D family protein [Rhodospirillaceae bacterium]
MLDQLPAIVVAVPLIAAAVCAIVRQQTACWLIALVVCGVSTLGSIAMLAQVQDYGPISYQMGGWAPPVGIEYRIDILSGYLLVLVSLIATAVLVYGRMSVQAEIKQSLRGWYYTMYLLCMCGLMGIVITGDAFNAFVFMEISSLSMYTLIALGKDRRALAAAYQYLIMGTIGATMYVIGVGLLFTITGTLNLVDMAERLRPLLDTPAAIAGMAFILVGLSLKIALFPLHLWLPSAYAYAPSAVTAFLAATATKVAIYLLMRFLYSVFGFGFAIEQTPIPEVILILSLIAIFAGSFSAIFQENVKRMLAYSSVAQIGYITLGIALADAPGLVGSLVHIANHAMMKGALFMLIGGIALQIGTVRLSDMAGLGKAMPLTMFGIVLAGFSMLGVPGTVGFVSKWYLSVGALENGWWWMVALLMVSSLLVLAYIGRVIEVAFFRERPAGAPALKDPPKSMLITSWVFVLACIYLGIDTSFTVGVAEQIVSVLLGAGQ